MDLLLTKSDCPTSANHLTDGPYLFLSPVFSGVLSVNISSATNPIFCGETNDTTLILLIVFGCSNLLVAILQNLLNGPAVGIMDAIFVLLEQWDDDKSIGKHRIETKKEKKRKTLLLL